MNTEEHDDLWHLLGKAKQPVASPYLSRNILRVIREEKQDKLGVLAWLRSHWTLTTAAACALVMTGLSLTVDREQPDQITMLLAEKVSQSSDYQVISHLDELLASEESSVWLEN